MDGSNYEHSDSDSGESWTILEKTPVYGEEGPEFPELFATSDRDAEKDEDTDGISIISESDHETLVTLENNESEQNQQSRPLEQATEAQENISSSYIDDNYQDPNGNIDVFLGDKNGKLKTYVHRRNKRLSTMLNIIVLGSVITAAGVAIGHMWGVKNDCLVNKTPSVNKILSNLYKLQEENAYLRNKLKELTALNNVQKQNKLNDNRKIYKNSKCKKYFEEPLNNKNIEKLVKCVDNENSNADKLLESHMLHTPEFEKEFISNIDELKDIYQQNKSWLDEEIARKLKREKSVKELKKREISNDISIEKDLIENHFSRTSGNDDDSPMEFQHDDIKPESDGKKVSYADSLKSETKNKKRNTNDVQKEGKKTKEYFHKQKPVKDIEAKFEDSSDEELLKDNRYIKTKSKNGKKKHDRYKSNKKQKRRNKYEQWEMKGGYMKDYETVSVPSLQEDLPAVISDASLESMTSGSKVSVTKEKSEVTQKNHKSNKEAEKDLLSWQEKRAYMRKEARKNLEKQLFEKPASDNAFWYFRRMHRRELCRTKGENRTSKKFSKRHMNYKTKH